jgi:hypothetical protein
MCGVVLRDGYIFSGTIAENIALAEKNPDIMKLKNTAEIFRYSKSGLPRKPEQPAEILYNK